MVYEKLEEISDRYKEGILYAVERILSYNIKGLRSIILFGSCARLHIRVGSDIDLLIVTEDHVTDRILKSTLRSDVEELPNGLKTDIVFSTCEAYLESDLRLYCDIRNQGITLWKEGVFSDEYEQLLRAGCK